MPHTQLPTKPRIVSLLSLLQKAEQAGVHSKVLRDELFPSSRDDIALGELLKQCLQYAWGEDVRSHEVFTWKKVPDGVVYFPGQKTRTLIARLGGVAARNEARAWPRGAELRARRAELNISVRCLLPKIGAVASKMEGVEAHDLLLPPEWIPGLVDAGILQASIPANQIPSPYSGHHLRKLRREFNIEIEALASTVQAKPIVVKYVEHYDLPVPTEWSWFISLFATRAP